MRTVFVTTMSIVLMAFVAQDTDWKLPMENGVVTARYTSKTFTSKKDICNYYFPIATSNSEVQSSMTAALDDKGSTFFVAKNYSVTVLLDGADMSALSAGKATCASGQNDTCRGWLNIVIARTGVSLKSRSGIKYTCSAVKAPYRIVFYNDNHYELVFRGLVVTSQEIKKGKLNQEEKDIEELYSETETDKKQQEFFRDIRYIMDTYHAVLTKHFDRKIKANDF
jgi:hypothetical protein